MISFERFINFTEEDNKEFKNWQKTSYPAFKNNDYVLEKNKRKFLSICPKCKDVNLINGVDLGDHEYVVIGNPICSTCNHSLNQSRYNKNCYDKEERDKLNLKYNLEIPWGK